MESNHAKALFAFTFLVMIVCFGVAVKMYSASVENSYSKPSSHNSSSDGKNAPLMDCPRIILELEDYIIFSNGTLFVEVFNLTLNSSNYIKDGDTVIFCDTPSINEKTKENWDAAHYLLSIFLIQTFIIAFSPTYIRIISYKNLGLILICLFLFNVALDLVLQLNLQTVNLWILLPYVLNFVTVIFCAWITLLAVDCAVLVIKIFAPSIYGDQLMIEGANVFVAIVLIVFALITMVSSFLDIVGICLSYPGYLDKAMEYLQESHDNFYWVLILTILNIIGCIGREVAFEKYADDFVLEFSIWNVIFLRGYFAVVSVWIFTAGIMIYKNWLATLISIILDFVIIVFCFDCLDFSEEKESFFSYSPIDGASRPVINDVNV